MMGLDPARRRKLIAAARLLQSSMPGERGAAAEALVRLLPEGVTLADLLEQAPAAPAVRSYDPASFRHGPSTPEPAILLRRWQLKARTVAAYPHMLNERELAFARDMSVRRDEPTPKQRAWLDNLAERVNAGATA